MILTKSPALLVVGHKYRELAQELLSYQQEGRTGVVGWLPEDGLVLTDFSAYMRFDALVMPWRIGTFALCEFRKEQGVSNTRIILLTGAKQSHCNAIGSANIFDSIIQVSDFDPPSPATLLNAVHATMSSAPNLEPIVASGRIAYFDYVDPHFSSNSTVSHLVISEGSRWCDPSVPQERQLSVCRQILENWKWRNRERNRIMDVRPFFGSPGDYSTAYEEFCFVLMPFEEPFTVIYEDHIKKVVERSQYSCAKADDFYSATEVIKDIWRHINRAAVIVADVTTRNPNVMYEIGIAHTVGKPVVLLSQSMDSIPFDLRAVRHIHYEYTPRGCKQLESRLAKAIVETAAEYQAAKGNENRHNYRCVRSAGPPPRFAE